MEASEHPGQEPESQEPGADAPEQETQGEGAADAPVNEGGDDAPAADRSPAHDQSPVASDAQDAIVGDPGLRDEQQPQVNEGGTGRGDTPVRTSAPPAGLQSGTPLPEDREGEGDETTE